MQNMFSKDSIEFLVLKNDFESQNFAIFGGHKQTNFALGLSILMLKNTEELAAPLSG